MNVIFFDDAKREQFLPLSFTRPVADLRIGILKISDKWNSVLEGEYSWLCEDYLSDNFPCQWTDDNLLINGRLLPDPQLGEALKALQLGQYLVQNDSILALRIAGETSVSSFPNQSSENTVEYKDEVFILENTKDIFTRNGEALERDFELLTVGRKSEKLDSSNTLIGGDGKLDSPQLFIEEGAVVRASIINVEGGPVYIGKDAEVMEGSIIRGPFAMCDHAVLKLAAKVYGPSTLGPHCKLGGEMNNSVFQGYSSKAHDGFIGNSVIGSWCNLGADTNTSNLKNNYGPVRQWDYSSEKMEDTGLTFCGLTMGDHSKSAINTQFNTGTTVGVNANVFGGGFPPKFIPSFSWGGAEGFAEFDLDKSIEVSKKVCARRDIAFDEKDEAIMAHLFATTARFRK